MDIIAIIILMGIVQGLFLGTLLILIESPNRRANRFLGILFICFSISISHFFFLRADLYPVFPQLVGVPFPVLFLFGPLFYFYVRILTDGSMTLQPRALLHALPFALTLIFMLPLYLAPAAEKVAFVHRMNDGTGVHMGLVLGAVQVLHISAYLIAVLNQLRSYDQRIRNTKSSIESINLRWLRIGTVNFILVFGMILVFIVIQGLSGNALPAYNVAVPISVSLIIYYMGYAGLRQPGIFSPSEDLPARRYEKSALTPETKAALAVRLKDHMERERPYLDRDLTLGRLSELLDVPPHHLSQVINESLKMNFFDFINTYRVEEARRLFLDPVKSTYTILAVAEEAGFNSKTAFNTAFKKLTRQTPSEFRAKTSFQAENA